MSSKLLVVFLFLASASVAVAQVGSAGDTRDRFNPGDAPDLTSQLKGMQPQSLLWDGTIAKLGNNPDGWTVRCFASDGDDLYIGGDFQAFDTVASQFLVHYNRKTKAWNALDQGPHNTVNAIAVHKGKVYVGGAFSTIGSARTTVSYISMWDGSTWESMAGGMNGDVNALAFIGDTLYAGGNFTRAGGQPANYLAYWDGTSWNEAFGGVGSTVNALVATHDSLFVVGNFVHVDNTGTDQVANGSALLHDQQWSVLGNGYGSYSATLFEGKLWVGGPYRTGDGILANGLASWDGSKWTTYGTDTLVGTAATGDVYGLVPVGDSLVVLGNFSQIAGVPANGIAVYHNGTWSNVTPNLYGYAISAIPFDGQLYVGGRFTMADDQTTQALIAMSNGTWTKVARTLNSYIGWQTDEVRAIATTDRYIFIGGNFLTIAGQTCNHVARWDKRTKQWSTLGHGVDGDVYSLAISQNNLIVGGLFNRAGGISARHIAMCDITQGIWSPMGDGAHRNVGAITVKDNAVYAAVFFQFQNTGGADYIGKWNGTAWTVYSPGLQGGFINALAWQGSTLFAGGSFNQTPEGLSVSGIAQLVDGQWGALNAGVGSPVEALAVSGGLLYVGGDFASADGLNSPGLASWDGSSWNAIGGVDYPVFALAADGKGGVYAGGRFTKAGGISQPYLVRWNGSTYESVLGGVSNTVQALATDTGSLFVGGWLESAGSPRTASLHFAELHGAGFSGVSSQIFVTNFSVFPNPVSAVSTISFSIEKPEAIHIDLFNSLGERVRTIGAERYDKGPHEISFESGDLPNGVYFLRINSEASGTTQAVVINR